MGLKNVHSSVHEREKESAIIMCVQFGVGLCQCIHICVCMYVLVCVCVRQGVHICVTVSMWEWGSVVCLCVEGTGCSPDQLGTAMVHAQCRKRQEQATYKLNGHTLKTSAFPLASSSMISKAMKRAIDTRIVLGCQSEQEVQGVLRFI